MEYYESHHHSRGSVLDGLGTEKEHLEKCIELGHCAFSFTEHGTIGNVITAIKLSKQYDIKYIPGIEAYVSYQSENSTIDKAHEILIVKNEIGWHNLMELIYSGRIRTGRDKVSRLFFTLEDVFNHHEGLICTSACMSGVLAQLILRDKMDEYRSLLARYLSIWNDDFYLEVHAHNIDEEMKIANVYMNEDIKTIAATDCHYINKEDSLAHGFLQSTRFGVHKAGIKSFSGEPAYYLHGYQEIIDRYQRVLNIDARPLCQNTLEIVDKCNFIPTFHSHMPKYIADDRAELTKEDRSNLLRMKCHEGINKRYNNSPPKEALDRLEYELMVINVMDFVDYFLLVADIVNMAKTNMISVGAGRGSGAGSIAAYCLGITNVDPLKYGLLFSRFLNYGRSKIFLDDFGINGEY